MRPLVTDASAGLKLVRQEPGSAEIARLVAERPDIVAPELFCIERVKVLIRRYR